MLLPSVEAGVRHTYSFGSSINQSSNQREALNTQYDQFYAQADWNLFNWKNILDISLSKLNKETSIYKLKQARNKVKLNVIQMFFAYQNGRSWLEVLETQISGMQEQIKRTEKKWRSGTGLKVIFTISKRIWELYRSSGSLLKISGISQKLTC